MERKIEDIIESLRKAKDRPNKCTILIGAGCSVKAGIPLASGFVEIIKNEHEQAYQRATEKTYPKCMVELAVGERRELIAGYINQAKINWAHIAIAQLMRVGYIDRVLTVNFDPLIVKACAMVGLYPAVYDFAASQLFKPAYIPTPAVFHLHGQHTGFVLMNTEEEVEEHSKRLKPLFDHAGRGRVWVVVGYSGENDPVFEHLAGVSEFDYNLYWIGYRDNEPAPHVREKLLSDKRKYAFYVRGFDADDFFVDLAQRLNCFPPGFVGRPFSHLNELLEMLTPYSLLGQSGETDVTASARELIIKAIKQYEEQPVSAAEATQLTPTLSAQALLLEGKYDQIITLLPTPAQPIPPELVDPSSWAYVMQGNALSEQAKTKSGQEADRLFAQAGEKYQAALAIKPDKHEALNNWGNALSDRARTKSGEEAERLLVQAVEKYQAALQIKPDYHEALNNWGAALLIQITKSGSGDKSASLFTKTQEVLFRAEEIRPGGGAYNLACLYALQNREVECREWLEKSYQHGTLPNREHLKKDTDLDNVREKEWFQKFLDRL